MRDAGNKKLHYDSGVVLVGAGEVRLEVVKGFRAQGWPVIAADGGADTLRKSGLLPDVIIGDLDSVADSEAWPSDTQVYRIDEQDTTDFEKCLYTVAAPLFVATGFTGNRFDHTLAGLHVLHKYIASHRVLLLAGGDVCFARRSDLNLVMEIGSRLSIFPLTTTQFISSAGLEYPLNSLRLQCGDAIGTSNRVSSAQVELKSRYGEYCVIVSARQLESLVVQFIH